MQEIHHQFSTSLLKQMQQEINFEQKDQNSSTTDQQKIDSSLYLTDENIVKYTNQNFNQLALISQKNISNYSQCSEDNKKHDQNFIKVQLIIKPCQIHQNFQINIFTGLQVTSDGVIRYFPSIQPVYFGYNQYETILVEDFSESLGLLNLKQNRRSNQTRSSYQQALQFIQYVPNIQQDLTKQIFTKFGVILDHLSDCFAQQVSSEAMFQQKDEEFKMFQEMCFKFLEQFYQQNSNIMFCYQIFRLSQKHNDTDFSHYGYSKSYLELLGINSEILSQIILRGKQIDLIPKKIDITNQGLNSLSMENSEGDDNQIAEIITFDGHPVKIYLKRKNYGNLFINSEIVEGEYEYYFLITEIDIDLYDLQQLINYRQRLTQNYKITYDDFIKKELSYLFEDVEYSIHSQRFIEKFYGENIQFLQKQQQQQCCGYRQIYS